MWIERAPVRRRVAIDAKLKLSQLFERDGIYGIEWRIAKSNLSNKLERGGTYGITYDR